jgi:hypothetical protein
MGGELHLQKYAFISKRFDDAGSQFSSFYQPYHLCEILTITQKS